MASKTCGDCKHRYTESVGKCRIWKYTEIPADRHCCGEFEQDKNSQQTNGDRIIAGGMSALVEYRQKFICHVCAYRFSKKCNGAKCSDGLLEWLNSENEVIYEE